MKFRALLMGPAFLAVIGAAEVSDAAPQRQPSPFRLCVLDQNALLLQSSLATNMAARFQQVRRQAQQSFENDSRTLDADSRALGNLRASLPEGVAKAKADDIARRRVQLQERGKQINRDLAELDAELTRNVMTLADPMVRAVQSEHGCSMLVARSNLLYLNDASLDITAAVLKKMNGSTQAASSSR